MGRAVWTFAVVVFIIVSAAGGSSGAVAQGVRQPWEVTLRGPGQVDDTLRWYVGAPVEIEVLTAPGAVKIRSSATLVFSDTVHGRHLLSFEPIVGTLPLGVEVRVRGQVTVTHLPIMMFWPTMRDSVERWPALVATVGERYDPSSAWYDEKIPSSHFHTVVEFDGATVLDREGTSFTDELSEALLVTPSTKSIITRVFWKPGGTADRTRWVLLASTGGEESAVVTDARHGVRVFESR